MKAKQVYIPNQHGAWAMVIVPFLFGAIANGWGIEVSILGITWLLAYLFSHPFLHWVKKKQKEYMKACFYYGVPLVLLTSWLLIQTPTLLKWSPVFLGGFTIHIYYAKHRKERAFINDIIAVTLFSVIPLVINEVGDGTWHTGVKIMVLCWVYFIGTVFYVKTTIREKNNQKFFYYSTSYHLLALVIMSHFYTWVYLYFFSILCIRAFNFPRLKLTVKQVGVGEILFVIVFVLIYMQQGI